MKTRLGDWEIEWLLKSKVFIFTPNNIHLLGTIFLSLKYCRGVSNPHDKAGTKANVAAIKVGQFLMIVNFIFKMEIMLLSIVCCLKKEELYFCTHKLYQFKIQEQMHFCPDIWKFIVKWKLGKRTNITKQK